MIDLDKATLDKDIIEYLKELTEEEFWKYIYEEYYVGKHLSYAKIANVLNYNISSIGKYFRKYSLQARSDSEKGRLYECNHDFFEEINTEEQAYWLGFMYADGYIMSQRKDNNRKVGLSIAEIDKHHLEKFKQCLKATYPINTYKVSNGYNPNSVYCRLLITSSKMAQDLIGKGCFENKTDIIQFPTEQQVPKHLRKHFIRGYFDGDGSIWCTNSDTTYSIDFCGTDDLLTSIMNELITENVIKHEYKFDKRKPNQTVSRLRFGGNQIAKSFCKYIYDDATIYLNRKYKKYQELLKIMSNYRKNQENICCVCGDIHSTEYNMWKHGGKYDGKMLCRKHWEQLRKYHSITDSSPVIHISKEKKCCVCGDLFSKSYHICMEQGEYQYKTLCRKHWEQIHKIGSLKDNQPAKHKTT